MCKKRHKTVPVFVPHLGCPQDCLFCDQKRITGQLEEMTVEKAAELIAEAVAHKKTGEYLEVGFFGGSFTGIAVALQESLLAVAQKAVQEGKVDGIRLSTRPDYINETILNRMKRFGVTCIELGAQSMDDTVLMHNRRGHSAKDTEKAAALIRANGFSLGLQMMIGLPGDTAAGAMQTAEKIAALRPDCVRIYPTMVIEGTGLCDLYRAEAYQPLSVENAVSICANLHRYFTGRNIEVIRMGLLEMDAESVVAGPWHPAFGELVRSAVCYDKLAEKLQDFAGETVTVLAHPKDVSVVMGQNKQNEKKLVEAFGLSGLFVLPDERLPRGEYRVEKRMK